MGYEAGSLFIYNKKFWLFRRYGTVEDFEQYVVLHGLDGAVIEVREKDCHFVLSPSEVDFEMLKED